MSKKKRKKDICSECSTQRLRLHRILTRTLMLEQLKKSADSFAERWVLTVSFVLSHADCITLKDTWQVMIISSKASLIHTSHLGLESGRSGVLLGSCSPHLTACGFHK